MQQNAATALTFDQLRDAVQGNIAAIRSISTLIPAGGAGDKVFPPTYEGGKYATEKRRIENQEVETVLLDSVQSQANRMELALLAAYNRGEIAFPLLAVDFSKQFPDIGEITALEAPHRIADAIFRDSLLGGNEFRKSEAGKRFSNANLKNATALLEICPTALIFGIWDSTNLDLRQGLRLERAIVSEIVGCKFIRGVKAESRIDPLAIEKAVTIYETADGSWTADENSA